MKFPSGEVKQQHRLGLQFLWESSDDLQIDLLIQRSFNRNEPSENELKFKLGYLLTK
jgi:hypothetical protein